MGGVISRQFPWTSQPQYPVEIDWSNPCSDGLVFCYESFAGVDLVRNILPAREGGITTAITQNGRADKFIRASSQGLNFGDLSCFDVGSNDFSFEILFRLNSQPATAQYIIFGKDHESGRQIWLEQSIYAGSLYLRLVWINGATITAQQLPVNAISTGIWYHLIIGRVANTVCAWLNGIEQTVSNTVDHAGFTSVASTATNAYIGRRNYTGYFDYLDGEVAFLRFRNKTPTNAAAKKLALNYWQIFQPQVRNLYVSGAGGGAVIADHILALEWPANLGISAVAQPEYLTALSASAQAPFEYQTTAAADAQTPADWLSGIVRDALAGIEYRGALAADSLAQIDYAALLRADDVALFEYELTARADHVSPVDWLSALQADAVVSAEWSGGILVNADAVIPLEWRSTVNVDGMMPVSIAQMLAVDQAIPDEFGAGIVRDQAAVLEWLSAIGADALLPLSTIALVRGDQAIMAEWGGTAAFVSGNINVFHIDARGTVWRLDARGTVWKITKH